MTAELEKPKIINKPYSGVQVWLLNRETGEEEKLVLYPVTKVILSAVEAPSRRRFEASSIEFGTWTEIKNAEESIP